MATTEPPPPFKLSTELLDLIVQELLHAHVDSGSQRSDLASLRLSCRLFHHCSTRHLFSTVHVCYDFSNRQPNSLRHLARISDCELGRHVETVIVGSQHGACRPDYEPLRTNFLEMASTFPRSISKLENLRALHVSASIGTMPAAFASAFPEELRSLFTNTIGHTLRLLFTSTHTRLTNLDLRLPLTYDFVQIARLQGPISQSIPPVHHLDLRVLDQSGVGGSADVLETPSHIQTLRPNALYGNGLSDLLKHMPGLRSLCVIATHAFDFDVLGTCPLRSLRRLLIRRLDFTQEGLAEIIHKNRNLQELEMVECNLLCGAWSQVFVQMHEELRLINLSIRQIGYGSASHEYSLSRPRPSLGSCLEAVTEDDQDALRLLSKTVGLMSGNAIK